MAPSKQSFLRWVSGPLSPTQNTLTPPASYRRSPTVVHLEPASLLCCTPSALPSCTQWIATRELNHEGSRREEQPLTEFTTMTWNVWFDEHLQELRYPALISEVLSSSADIICLQECTLSFTGLYLLPNSSIQTDFVVTHLEEQLQRTRSWYGTVILVRRNFIVKHGCNLRAWFLRFPGSTQGRGLNIIEFKRTNKVILRVATSHFESMQEDAGERSNQFLLSSNVLSQPSTLIFTSISPSPAGPIAIPPFPTIMCGDHNIYDPSELSTLLSPSHGFLDAAGGAAGPTFFTTYTEVPNKDQLEARTIDYMLYRNLVIKEWHLLGVSAVKALGKEVMSPWGKEGKVWKSDHFGVLAQFGV